MKKVLIWLLLFTCLLSSTSFENKDQTAKPSKNYEKSVYNSKSSILNVKILDISFFNDNGTKIQPVAGWIHINKNVKIIVQYRGRADQIDYIFTPTGTETYKLQRIIGSSFVKRNNTRAEFVWAPDKDQSLGYITVSIIQGSYSLKAGLINVISK